MASVEIRLKLNVDLEIKAEREDIPGLTDSVKQQLAGAFSPAAVVANGQREAEPVQQLSLPAEVSPPPTPSKPRRSRRTTRTRDTVPAEDDAVDWVHDPSKWGHPAQSWSTVDKCLWLLYVVKQEKSIQELSGPVIAATLCKHFRQAGLVYRQIVNRELGKLKSVTPAPVGENSTVSPSKWFLTEEGNKRAENLVAQIRSQVAQSTT